MTSNTKPNEVLVLFSDNDNQKGAITGYQCDYHVQSGTIEEGNGIEVSSYYDMLYPCDMDPGELIQAIEPAVLTNLAEYFELLPEGSVCTIPDTTLPLWVIGISSYPADTLVSDVECQKLTTNGNSTLCCGVVHSPMTFWWTDREYQRSEILGVLSVEFNGPKATSAVESDGVTIQYVGAYMERGPEDGQGNLPPAISSPDDSQGTQSTSKSGSQFTTIGGFVLAALVLVFVAAVIMVFVQRRRRQRKHQNDIQDAVAKSDDTHSDGPTLEVDVMSDGCDFPPNSQQLQPFPYSWEDEMANTPNSYTFDLANSMKLDVLGTYSGLPTSMAVVPPYPMEETSDSEVDSWAQTDGTVGSLEDRLEEITAEI